VNIEIADGEEPISGREAGESGNLSAKYFSISLAHCGRNGKWVGGGGGHGM